MIKVAKNRPYYNHLMMCYCVEFTDDNGHKHYNYYNTYQEGIDFLKNTYPNWFNKHFTTN